MCEILTSTSSEAFSGQNEMLYEIPEFTRLINTYNNQQIQHNQHSQQFPNQFQEHLTETTYNGESSVMTNNNIQSISSNNYPVNDHRQMRQEMVEHLVDTTKLIIDCIWANFPVQPSAKVIPLRVFIQEILRRSRTSWSTLQTTLFYLVRMKPKIELLWLNSALSTSSDQQDQPNKPNDPATCGRRMFLASLIVASKYLQDRNYSNNAWSKICGLSVQDINAVERRFLMLIEYNLFIGEDVFKHWTNLLNSHIMTISRSSENTSGNNVTIKREDLKEDENQNATRFKQILWMQRPQTVECSVKG